MKYKNLTLEVHLCSELVGKAQKDEKSVLVMNIRCIRDYFELIKGD